MSVVSARASVAAEPPLNHNEPCLVHRFTVDQYERMTEIGFLTSDDRVELLEGVIVDKMTQNPPHNATIDFVREALEPLLPKGWRLREQKAIRVPSHSAPEPDLAIVLGPASRYVKRHPEPRDVTLIIEVADSSLDQDRGRKRRIYAEARNPIYWIVNLVQGMVEVYTAPKGGKSPTYRERRDFRPGEAVPVVIDGKEVGQLLVGTLLPRFASE